MMKKVVINVLNILNDKGDSYIDPAEHIRDSVNVIKRHLDDADLSLYIDDFIWGLESAANGDFDGVLAECVELLKSSKN